MNQYTDSYQICIDISFGQDYEMIPNFQGHCVTKNLSTGYLVIQYADSYHICTDTSLLEESILNAWQLMFKINWKRGSNKNESRTTWLGKSKMDGCACKSG